MRLAAQAKMGYYPTPPSIIPIIKAFLKRSRQGLIRVLDPCAGEGTAVNEITEHLQAESYGIEIDHERGGKAKEVLTRCLVTDYQDTKISHGAFSLLYLNPPYDWATREEDIEKSERYEKTFLRNTTPYLCSGGILIYLIPQRRLDTHIAKMLSYRFEKLSVFLFPEAEYQAFKQLAIFGVLKNRPEKDDTVFEYLKDCGTFKAQVPFLPEDPIETYQVPSTPSKASFVFSSKKIDRQDLALEIEQHGLFDQFRDMTRPRRFSEKIRPIMPLRHGHLAQILACGLMNGIVWDTHKSRPLLVKGITKKVVNHAVEVQGDVEKHIETDQIKILINAFNQRGELLTIE
ncbi:class I SAM-dependent methyltransferase [Candidatus Parcubacteria bacterium]|jgi:hypothetical protein|nr:MAG: class I SAM-dependent methyltransferase [Candidatus Parcubacteria bacterium]